MGSELSELAIHRLLVETRAIDLDREVYQDPGSDRHMFLSEKSSITREMTGR